MNYRAKKEHKDDLKESKPAEQKLKKSSKFSGQQQNPFPQKSEANSSSLKVVTTLTEHLQWQN